MEINAPQTIIAVGVDVLEAVRRIAMTAIHALQIPVLPHLAANTPLFPGVAEEADVAGDFPFAL
jgi:hypothetical protein